MISYILAIFCAAAFLGIDQITKHFVSATFELGESREFLNGFIDLLTKVSRAIRNCADGVRLP